MSADNQGELDTALIARVKAKEPEALGEFIEMNRGRLLGFLRSITGEHIQAVTELDDLLQEVAAAALKGLETAPLDQYEPMQWLQQVARRRVTDAHRHHFDAQKRDVNRERSLQGGGSGDESGGGLEALLIASMTSPSAAVSRDIRMQRIIEAIETLGEDQRNAIRMRYVDGLSTKEVAKRIGKTDVATRVLLSRSMRDLESKLSDVRPSR